MNRIQERMHDPYPVSADIGYMLWVAGYCKVVPFPSIRPNTEMWDGMIKMNHWIYLHCYNFFRLCKLAPISVSEHIPLATLFLVCPLRGALALFQLLKGLISSFCSNSERSKLKTLAKFQDRLLQIPFLLTLYWTRSSSEITVHTSPSIALKLKTWIMKWNTYLSIR